ncbi:MAG TPA: hypothetical protein VK858_21855 [Longimicrobiales bacterium]|nr:hypothetical protein [Longimicrobiales bacterium]
MQARPLLLVGLFTLAGCAAGTSTPALPPVPVFFAPAEVPCEYEMVEAVRRQTRETIRNDAEWRRIVTRLLGPEGARVGADAVLAEDFEEGRLPFTVSTSRSVSSDLPPETTLEGDAIRYLEPCG